MKFIGIIIYLFLLACAPMGSDPVVLRDSTTGENLDSACSSNNEDDDRIIYSSLQGECDHVPKPSPLYRVTRLVIGDEVCCVLQAFIDHGNGQITPIGK